MQGQMRLADLWIELSQQIKKDGKYYATYKLATET